MSAPASDWGRRREALLQELVGLIKDHPDGVGGFLNQFKSAGFGDQVASWLGDSEGAALSGPQVEKALGRGVIAAIASKLALRTGDCRRRHRLCDCPNWWAC